MSQNKPYHTEVVGDVHDEATIFATALTHAHSRFCWHKNTDTCSHSANQKPKHRHTHTDRAFNNCVTLTFDLLRVNAHRATTIRCMSVKFGVDSSSRFLFRARTRTESQTPLITLYPRMASATFGVGNFKTSTCLINA